MLFTTPPTAWAHVVVFHKWVKSSNKRTLVLHTLIRVAVRRAVCAELLGSCLIFGLRWWTCGRGCQRKRRWWTPVLAIGARRMQLGLWPPRQESARAARRQHLPPAWETAHAH
eukprot:14669677-Alexandrium_andersonii.AAC.1